MVPSSRLLIWTAAAGLPAALLLVAAAEAWALAAFVWGTLAAVAAADAALAPRRLQKVTVAMPALVRLTHELAGPVEVRIAGTTETLDLRIAPILPADLEVAAAIAEVRLARPVAAGESSDPDRTGEGLKAAPPARARRSRARHAGAVSFASWSAGWSVPRRWASGGHAGRSRSTARCGPIPIS